MTETRAGAIGSREQTEQRVHDVLDGFLSAKSKRNYGNCQKSFAKWLLLHHEECLEADGTIRGEMVLQDLHIFYEFILARFDHRDEEGQQPGVTFATLSNYRSAFVSLLGQQGLRMNEDQTEEFSKFFISLKKQDRSRRMQQGGGAAKQGKDPMPFELYRTLARELFQSEDASQHWAHLYMLLTWNLMCRSISTSHIRLSDLTWYGDCLQVHLGTTGQGGDTGKVARHVFANPLDASICPITALGVYLLQNSGRDALLLPARNQQGRFSRILHKFMNSSRGEEILARFGRVAKDFGSLSLRKGATSYAASGSTASPSALSTLTRGGWATGAPWQSYVGMMPAGDCYLGRLLAGMPPLDADFGLLPPHFNPEDPFIEEVVHQVFPTLLAQHSHLTLVAKQCLASLVHHSAWIKEHAPLCVRQHDLFTNGSLLKSLQEVLVVGQTSPYMVSSGVPPHVRHSLDLAVVREEQRRHYGKLQELMERGADSVVERLEAVLDANSGGITLAALRECVTAAVHEAAANVPIARHEQEQAAEGGSMNPMDAAAAPDRPLPESLSVYHWGGALHMVPEDWVLPKVGLKRGWELWCRGSGAGAPPYRSLQPSDRRKHRFRYNEWKTVFSRVEAYLHAVGSWIGQPTMSETAAMFEDAMPLMVYVMGDRPRIDQLKPTYACKRFNKLSLDDVRAFAREGGALDD